MSLPGQVQWFRVTPFFLLHAASLFVLVDVSYYLLVVMSWFGLVWDLKPVPARVFALEVAAAGKRA